MLRVIREIKPSYIVGENVAGLLSWSGGLVFNEVHADLEASGYEVQAVVIPAAAVNAPHGRDRVWFVAYSISNGNRIESISQTISIRKEFIDKSKIPNAPHSNSNGLHTSDSGYEEQPSEGRQYAQRDADKSNEDGDATDSNYKRLEGQYREWEGCSEHRNNERVFTWTENKFNAANTNSTNNKAWTQRKILGESHREKTNGYSNVECGNKWQHFPTVSPVCSRNDGLSNRLDGITFSKWRKESIKAAGNAVVPQVVYEIFKAIESTRK